MAVNIYLVISGHFIQYTNPICHYLLDFFFWKKKKKLHVETYDFLNQSISKISLRRSSTDKKKNVCQTFYIGFYQFLFILLLS